MNGRSRKLRFVWLLALAAIRMASGTEESEEAGEKAMVLLSAKQASMNGGEPEVPNFADAERQEERDRMVERQIAGRDVDDPSTLSAMRAVPRHRLVPKGMRRHAYKDRPLPIGHGQTISQPYIVGLMTQLLEVDADDRVLEVGTGSGYQAAILAQIVEEVVSIEIVKPLAERAARDLESLGYGNVTVLHGDGYFGYEPMAPYDAIVVTAAAEHIPPPLIEQLKPEGRMMIPVGRSGWTQNLILVEKSAQGKVSTRNILAVRFVPLTREDD